VCDITSIGSRKNLSYLALITDAYSKKGLLGINAPYSLNASGSLEALDIALKNKQEPLIHHFNREPQYYANDYHNFLNDSNILPSTTEQYDPYKNAIAESINGMLKQEFNIDKYHTELKTKADLVKSVIKTYNQIRPHLSNYMLTSNQIHAQSKLKTKKVVI